MKKQLVVRQGQVIIGQFIVRQYGGHKEQVMGYTEWIQIFKEQLGVRQYRERSLRRR